MRAVIAIVVLLAIAAGAWLLRDRWLPREPVPERAAASPPAAAPVAAPEPGTATVLGGSAEPPSELVREQAERYVAKLTEPDPEPVNVASADHFVTGDQVLSMIPEEAVERTTVEAIGNDPTIGPDTPITVVREVEQVERLTPEKLIAESGGNLDKPIRVLEDSQVRETTVREVLEKLRRTPDTPIDVVTTSDYYEQTTPRELAQRLDIAAAEPIRIIRKRHGVEASSIEDLMRTQAVSEDSLYYVRTVRPGDEQGIWGIVHDGIIKNFARGMAIRRGKEINTYQVEIPKDADERRPDQSSSFLGRLIHEKTKASYVYNYSQNRMGRNPDRIYPGQEIVIINFQPDELIRIYTHFVDQRG